MLVVPFAPIRGLLEILVGYLLKCADGKIFGPAFLIKRIDKLGHRKIPIFDHFAEALFSYPAVSEKGDSGKKHLTVETLNDIRAVPDICNVTTLFTQGRR